MGQEQEIQFSIVAGEGCNNKRHRLGQEQEKKEK